MRVHTLIHTKTHVNMLMNMNMWVCKNEFVYCTCQHERKYLVEIYMSTHLLVRLQLLHKGLVVLLLRGLIPPCQHRLFDVKIIIGQDKLEHRSNMYTSGPNNIWLLFYWRHCVRLEIS